MSNKIVVFYAAWRASNYSLSILVLSKWSNLIGWKCPRKIAWSILIHMKVRIHIHYTFFGDPDFVPSGFCPKSITRALIGWKFIPLLAENSIWNSKQTNLIFLERERKKEHLIGWKIIPILNWVWINLAAAQNELHYDLFLY